MKRALLALAIIASAIVVSTTSAAATAPVTPCLDGTVLVAPVVEVPGWACVRFPIWTRDWDRRADCETGQRLRIKDNGRWRTVILTGTAKWDTNTGNEFYGGLQEGMHFWRSYGGLKFAPRPDLATPDEQKIVAEEGLKSEHDHAWPWCSDHGY